MTTTKNQQPNSKDLNQNEKLKEASREKIDQKIGLDRIEKLAKNLEFTSLDHLSRFDDFNLKKEQPWIILGCSDGMGLQTTIAAIACGVLKYGVGVYWEPPHFLELDGQTPRSPVHYARRQNALGLKAFAQKHGAHLEIVCANCIMAPQRGLKGEIKTPPNALNDEIVKAVTQIRQKSPNPDIVLINSVAFGKWMSPREGVDPIEVPTVNFNGEIVFNKTKPYHPRGYQETLDTMGRNHKLLLETAREKNWLGPNSLTAFFTWAGGSQNIDVLKGIYGYGALGDAKAIAESDTAEFRLKHGLKYGAHAIVRLPAFLSVALMGIPGGGLFGLISRHYLQQRHVFFDMPTLASRTIRRLIGDEWVRENPISQIELDMQETLYITELSQLVQKVNQRIFDYVETNNHPKNEPIPLDKSIELLSTDVPPNYPEILKRFRPDEKDQKNENSSIKQTPQPSKTEKSETTQSNSTEKDEKSTRFHFGSLGQTLKKHATSFFLDEKRQAKAKKRDEERYFGQPIPGQKNNDLPLSVNQTDLQTVSESGDIRPDIPLFDTLNYLRNETDIDLSHLTIVGEDLIVEGYLGDARLTTHYNIQKKDGSVFVHRTIKNDQGRQVATGTLVLGASPRLKVDQDCGEPLGHEMHVRTPLDVIYGSDYSWPEIQRAALLKFVADQIRASGGLLDDTGRLRLSARFGQPIDVGQSLRAFAKSTENAYIITILGKEDVPFLRAELRH